MSPVPGGPDEEHAKEPDDAMSRALMRLGYRVFYCDDALRLTAITDRHAIGAVKVAANRGYNFFFFACRPGSAVHERILSLASPYSGG